MRLVIGLLCLMWAASAQAGIGDWTYCGGGASTNSSVGNKECIQRTWDYDHAEGFSIRVMADTALITFQPDKDGTNTGINVRLKKCLAGYVPTNDAGSAESCTNLTDSAWNGSGGSASNQRFAERVGPGLYWIEITATGALGDAPFIQVQGD